MVVAWRRADVGEVKSINFPIDHIGDFGVPAQGELKLEVSCPIFLRRDKTLAFLIFRHSEGLGNYVEGAFNFRKARDRGRSTMNS